MTLIIFFISLAILLVLGAPIFISLGLSSSVIWLSSYGSFEPSMLFQKMLTGLDSFPLMAIPFFMLAGELMNTGGLSRRLVNFAQKLVGWIPGGLGFAVVVASMFIAAILGSASASAAMIGMVMIPAMTARGYKIDYSSALVASAGAIGPIIPPSIPFIVYGVIAQVSIAKLFVGGYVPGVLMGLGMMIYNLYHARKEHYPAEKFPTAKELLIAFKDAFFTLLLPVIIMGGILLGVFTPTEAGVVSAVYAFIIGFVIYREIPVKEVPKVFLRAANSTAMVLMVMAVASYLSWVLTLQQVPQTITKMLIALSDNKIVFLLIINAFMIIVGMFLDAVSALTIMTPVLLPTALALGVDPILFGVMMSVNLSIGVLTPPVGLNLYVVSGIAKISLVRISKAVMPFLYIIGIVLLIMVFFPQLVTYFPNLLIK